MQAELMLANSLPAVNSAPPSSVACGDDVWAKDFLYSRSHPALSCFIEGSKAVLGNIT